MSFDKIFDLTAGVYFHFYNKRKRAGKEGSCPEDVNIFVNLPSGNMTEMPFRCTDKSNTLPKSSGIYDLHFPSLFPNIFSFFHHNRRTPRLVFRVSSRRGSVFKFPGPLTHRPRGQRRRSIYNMSKDAHSQQECDHETVLFETYDTTTR